MIMIYSPLTDEERAAVDAFGDGLRLYSLKQVAAILRVTPRTILTYVKAGKLRGKKIGRGWKFLESEIQRFISGDFSDESDT